MKKQIFLYSLISLLLFLPGCTVKVFVSPLETFMGQSMQNLMMQGEMAKKMAEVSKITSTPVSQNTNDQTPKFLVIDINESDNKIAGSKHVAYSKIKTLNKSLDKTEKNTPIIIYSSDYQNDPYVFVEKLKQLGFSNVSVFSGKIEYLNNLANIKNKDSDITKKAENINIPGVSQEDIQKYMSMANGK